jgi:hypothetical protein
VDAGATTAAAVDAAARCVERGSTERRRGAEWAVRIEEEEERPRAWERMGARRKGRCHSCGRREATEATGFGIPAGVPRRRPRREEPGVLRFGPLGLGREEPGGSAASASSADATGVQIG